VVVGMESRQRVQKKQIIMWMSAWSTASLIWWPTCRCKMWCGYGDGGNGVTRSTEALCSTIRSLIWPGLCCGSTQGQESFWCLSRNNWTVLSETGVIFLIIIWFSE
jgi:hypothetical protein